MNQPSTSHYTFGDNDLAAARLERLAAAYAASSSAFMREALPQAVERAVDIGSGLGLTTKLLSELSSAPSVIGYERSTQYIQLAKSRHPTLAFRQVDVMAPPYPDRDLDVIYSRFLLTHLHAPATAMIACVEHLRPGGRLLLEETSDLASTIPTLKQYYSMVGEMQAYHGQELYIGLRLAAIAHSLAGIRVTAKQTPITLQASRMAELHAMNIATWKHEPHMLEVHGLDALEQLEAALNSLAQSNETQPPVTCVMAQIVVERV